MSFLPIHGRVECTLCYERRTNVVFDRTERTSPASDWRIRANPLAWGNEDPEIVVLGFSKGPTQAGALATSPHEEIAFKKGRLAVGKILRHVGLIPRQTNDVKHTVDALLSDREGRFHFGSLVRCTVERYDEKKGEWVGSGGGMLDKFVSTPFGQEVVTNCSERFLGNLPSRTRLVVMFGLGTKNNYVSEARKLLEKVRGGEWKTINEVAYTDGKVVFVHVEHFASQGALIPNWLGENQHPRAQLGLRAREAVQGAMIFPPAKKPF